MTIDDTISYPGMREPHHCEISEKALRKTALGQKTLSFLQEAIEQQYVRFQNVKQFLKCFRQEIKGGTCFGQASAIMIAAGKVRAAVHRKDFGTKILARAKSSDRICLQMLSHLWVNISN